MTFLMILLLTATVLIVQTVRLLIHDGRGSQTPPVSHVEDPQFRSPALG